MIAKRMRRIPAGWEVVDPDGTVEVSLDDGTVLRGPDELVGTTEAAEIAGVRTPNFVRDWAARPDFPTPVGRLSSGRVWRARDVRAYVARRRAPKPGRERLVEIARRVAWWDEPERTLARPNVFIARVLAGGTAQDVAAIQAAYDRRALQRAVHEAPAGIFDARTWNYWHLMLDLPRDAPLPARRSA